MVNPGGSRTFADFNALVARPWRAEAGTFAGAAGATALAILVAVGLSAGQWLPSLAAAAASGRATLSAAAQGYWSVHPAGLVRVVPFDVNTIWSAVMVGSDCEAREPLMTSGPLPQFWTFEAKPRWNSVLPFVVAWATPS